MQKLTLVSTVKVKPEYKSEFVQWQSEFHKVLAKSHGFLSFEITATAHPNEWLLVQQFHAVEDLLAWKNSEEKKKVFALLREMLSENPSETESDMKEYRGGMTEVFVTEVNPGMEAAFKEWLSKIHHLEAQFKGFKGMLIQSPAPGQKNWISLLQFDTLENLDVWLASQERETILEEARPLIANMERHRVISPFAGWFTSASKDGAPAVWKQTMIVLLVLYPIVMLELYFLNPLLKSLPFAVSTFIGNAISVSLVSWPMVPLAIYFLGWWLTKKTRSINIKGCLVVALLYLIEVLVFLVFKI